MSTKSGAQSLSAQMGCPRCLSSRRAAALLEYQASGAARLRQSAAAAFTDWHASDLSQRLVLKCKEKTEADLALIRAARAFTLQHADFQRCRVDGMGIAEQASKTFRTPAGQLHFEWACLHSMDCPDAGRNVYCCGLGAADRDTNAGRALGRASHLYFK